MSAVTAANTPTKDRLDNESKRRASILVVDDESGIRNFLQRALVKEYGLVEVADSAEAAEELRSRCHFNLLIVDVRLPGRSGLEWIEAIRSQGCDADVIFITAYAELNVTISALRFGAADFILKPFRLEQILSSVERCLERRALQQENSVLRRQVDGFVDRLYGGDGMIGQSEAMQNVERIITRIAPTPSSVLIQGETGTGKELAASAVHRFSGRSGPFVPVNCVAISQELFESELFGHTKGAFTGAHISREGLFSVANNGTLFLDEISELPAALQAKLLRSLESRRVRPVGADREVAIDVRLIAATNQDLAYAVRRGKFREDLFYRLNVVTLQLPPLRERTGDIPELAAFFLETLSAELRRKPIQISTPDMQRLQSYAWPGNVRELKNVIERALLLGQLPWESFMTTREGEDADPGTEPTAAAAFDVDLTLEQVEREHMLRVLDATGGNKSEAARRLGVSRKTMERKLRSWRAETPDA
jgi:two-component system NtrC family response regulator